jgi:SET domain-containing protein
LENSGGLLQSKSSRYFCNLKDWLPIDSLHKNACKIVQDSISANSTLELERIEIKKDKGMVKFIAENYWGIQLDGAGKFAY